MVFPVVMYGCDSWNIKKAEHRRIDALNCGVGEDSWESLGLQGDQSWVFIWRTDIEAETPILWPPDVKSWLIWKDPDAGKGWGEGEKGMTENVMVGWHHWLNGHEFEQTPGEWRTENTGVLQSMGSQRVGHNLATEQQQIIKKVHKMKKFLKI